MELSLDDPCQLFFPGEVVMGVLRLHNIDELIGMPPIVRVNGYTIVWKTNSKCDTEEYCSFFEDQAVMNKILPENNNSTTSLNLPTEIYSSTYKFHFVLPDNLPPSYEVQFGHTRYKISANFNSNTAFTYFSVGQWVGLKKRANSVDRKTSFIPSLCICWCPVVKASFHLEQTQYLPGETVYLDAVIKNNSWDDIIYSKAFIVQNTKYVKTHHIIPIKYKRTVVEETRGLISSGHNQVWSRQPLYIPPVIPTTKKCNNPFNFFDVEYKLKIHIVMKSSKEKTLFSQRLLIGNWDDSMSCTKLNDHKKKPIQLLQFSTDDCQMSKLQNNDFKPKYVVYQTN
ncbi:arrestin domain-containing protein 17-like [Adelges cooleyi]|uniref:arrestin domain-containing protein 17-like n=1 Tax=Adelges cooleyi TaxID=133065 RepID=UPI00217F2984|nr:arrestin domain-containing protein 17-like [Adelges cooleyi]